MGVCCRRPPGPRPRAAAAGDVRDFLLCRPLFRVTAGRISRYKSTKNGHTQDPSCCRMRHTLDDVSVWEWSVLHMMKELKQTNGSPPIWGSQVGSCGLYFCLKVHTGNEEKGEFGTEPRKLC